MLSYSFGYRTKHTDFIKSEKLLHYKKTSK